MVKRINYETRPKWLAARPGFLGASDSPGLFGVGFAGQNEYSLFAEKTGAAEPSDVATEAMELGLALQPTIISLFHQRSGIEVVATPPYEVVFADKYPFIGATLDGEVRTEEGPGVLEAKNVGEWTAREWEADEPPLRVQVQGQHQLLCTDYNFGYTPAMLGGNRLVWRRFERHERFIAALIQRLLEFRKLVETNTPPPVDGSMATTDALKRLYPEDDGEVIALPADSCAWDRNLVELKENLKLLETDKRLIENQFRSALGTATIGLLPDGGQYTLKEQTSHHKAQDAYTSTFRVLRKKKGN